MVKKYFFAHVKELLKCHMHTVTPTIVVFVVPVSTVICNNS